MKSPAIESMLSRATRIFFVLVLALIAAQSQTYQTTLGLPLPTNEYGKCGLPLNNGEFLILAGNVDHPSGLFNKSGDLHFIRLNAAGQVINPSKIIGYDVFESAVWFEPAKDCNGNPGYIIAANEFGAGANNIQVIFTDVSGNPKWVRRIGSPADDEQASCIQPDGNGNFILVGTKTNINTHLSSIIAVKLDCSGNLLWHKVFQPGLTSSANSVTAFATFSVSCSNLPNDYFICGSGIPFSGGNQSVLLLSITASNGQVNYSKFYDLGTGTDDIGSCIKGTCPNTVTANAQLWISGHSVDPFDLNDPKKVMVMTLDMSGNPVWANTYNVLNSPREFSTHLQFDPSNKIVLTGKAEETGVSDPPETGTCMLMRLQTNGNSVDWTRLYPMGFSSHGNRVEVDAQSNYFIAGHSFDIPVFRRFNYDVLAIKTDPQGKTDSVCYTSPQAIVMTKMPAVINSTPFVQNPQEFSTTIYDTVHYTEIQVHCPNKPLDPCDLINLQALFSFSSSGQNAFFTDNSQSTGGTIISWNWDFGDGSTSTLQNPSHTYATGGVYVVCLAVAAQINGVICRDTFCRDIFISQNPPGLCNLVQLNANFSFSGNNTNYSFTDLSSVQPNFNLLSWLWDFGDGNTSTAQHPTHTYATAGNYTVCLYVTGGNVDITCFDTICKTIMVPFMPFDSCPTNLLSNGGFNIGAIAGDLGFNGASANWTKWVWSPQVVLSPYCHDTVSMLLWGNQAVGEGFYQNVNIQSGGIYQISFCGTRLNTTYPNAQARFRLSNGTLPVTDYFNCNSPGCDEIFLSPVMTNSWVDYVSAPWTATQSYNTLTVSVWNNFNTQNKAFTSWLRIDNICLRRIGTVQTKNENEFQNIKLFPNPNRGKLTIQFEEEVQQEFNLSLLDFTGSQILKYKFTPGGKTIELDLRNISSGIYFINLERDKASFYSGKLILMPD